MSVTIRISPEVRISKILVSPEVRISRIFEVRTVVTSLPKSGVTIPRGVTSPPLHGTRPTTGAPAAWCPRAERAPATTTLPLPPPCVVPPACCAASAAGSRPRTTRLLRRETNTGAGVSASRRRCGLAGCGGTAAARTGGSCGEGAEGEISRGRRRTPRPRRLTGRWEGCGAGPSPAATGAAATHCHAACGAGSADTRPSASPLPCLTTPRRRATEPSQRQSFQPPGR